ncbi:hypothetical protein NQ314_006659 [Rhamnusium bicolor]|uniref:Uncharacterized protein n=1 Tax=Rhamnusium bicolor TaxID=1586634 RepID=A0AAV8YYQ7_9CUCU|nr:hypothetical protein NQ314_006659 [Rhamnusium bicolor]
MLVLVTIVSVNNGFIGFLILVVGLSSVLARLQDSSRRPAVVPYVLPSYHHHGAYHHDWDRNDKGVEGRTEKSYTQSYPPYNQQYVYTPLSTHTHNPSYYGHKNI